MLNSSKPLNLNASLMIQQTVRLMLTIQTCTFFSEITDYNNLKGIIHNNDFKH